MKLSFSKDPVEGWIEGFDISHSESRPQGDLRHYHFRMSSKGFRELLDRIEMHPDTGPAYCSWHVSVLLDRAIVRLAENRMTPDRGLEAVDLTIKEFMGIPMSEWKEAAHPTALKKYAKKYPKNPFQHEAA